MKSLKLACFLASMFLAGESRATQYVIIHQRFWGSYRLIYVSKPKDLKKWHYDSKNDTYYRAKDVFGIPVRITSKVRTAHSS